MADFHAMSAIKLCYEPYQTELSERRLLITETLRWPEPVFENENVDP